MRTTQIADLRVRIAGGADRDGGGDGPVVVLLHGFGAPGDDLVSLWRTIAAPAGTRFVFPEAPIDLGDVYGNGRAWWFIDLEARVRRQAQGMLPDPRAIPEGLDAARSKMEALLGELAGELGAPPAKIVLGGFSQGAMLSLDVALQAAQSVAGLAGLVLMSGTHIAADQWAKRYERLRGVPVFMSHGREDALLPFATADALCGELVSHGVQVEWRPFRGGHGIPGDVLEAVGAFLRRVLG
jgi:phospholipase/carboxylesterase